MNLNTNLKNLHITINKGFKAKIRRNQRFNPNKNRVLLILIGEMLGITVKEKTQNTISVLRFDIVRAGRLELPRREALDPKSSMSTNSITPANGVQI